MAVAYQVRMHVLNLFVSVHNCACECTCVPCGSVRTPFAIVRVICVLVSVMLELTEREYVLC